MAQFLLTLWTLLVGVGFYSTCLAAEAPVNKRLAMYELYYLPYNLEFHAGRTPDAVLPYLIDPKGQPSRLVEAHELVAIDAKWNAVRRDWKKKSLLEDHRVAVGKSMRVAKRLVSHHVSIHRSAVDSLSAADKKAFNESLKGKSPEVVASFYQLRFLNSLLEPSDATKFNFFIVSPSWCESSREYRILLETYFKKFPNPELTLHSLVVEDPKKDIFESRLTKELFPHPEKYSHQTVPRFIALQTTQGQTKIWEEGEALRELYDRYYAKHRGFLAAEAGK